MHGFFCDAEHDGPDDAHIAPGAPMLSFSALTLSALPERSALHASGVEVSELHFHGPECAADFFAGLPARANARREQIEKEQASAAEAETARRAAATG